MVVREVYEIVTDSLSSDSKNGFSRRVLFVGYDTWSQLSYQSKARAGRGGSCRIPHGETKSPL